MKYVVIVLGLMLTSGVKAQPAADIIKYIETYRGFAMAEMQRTGVPASIKLAQGIHETFAGKSDLVLKSNNHFGIKCKSTWTGEKVYHDDDARGECFRSYTSPVDSYRDHSDFLKNGPRYAFLFEMDPEDYKGWAYGLKKAGYATNVKYSQIIIRLIEEYNLQQYTLIALGKMKADDEMLARNNSGRNYNNVPVVKVVNTEVVVPVEEPSNFPSGVFSVNNTRVVYASAGTSILSVAEQHNISYSRLLDFNDMKDVDVLQRGQLLYLQRKRKIGSADFHLVQQGETTYDIAQKEGIRLESLLALNLLQANEQPAAGVKLMLREKAAEKPALQSFLGTASTSAVLNAGEQNIKPEKALHVVQTKETLYSIARKYGVEIEKIREWNQLTSFDLRIGQELVILKN